MNNDQRPRFRTPEARAFMALVLAMDPTVAPWLRKMFRMGVRNIRHDRILFTNPGGTPFEVPDPGAWSGDINPNVGIMLLRTREGEWWLNGF